MLKIKSLKKPRANKISTTVYFYSRKLGRQVWCNSNLEWDVAINLDIDPTVIDYCEQGIKLKWSKSDWTPDFVVLLENNGGYSIIIIEVKYLQELLENREKYEKKYSESKIWLEQNKNSIIKHLTDLPIKKIEFLVVTDQIMNQSFRVQNFRKFIQASVDPIVYIDLMHHIKAILRNHSKIMFKDLVDTLELKLIQDNITSDQIRTTIYEMIYNFELFIDYEKLFTSRSSIYNPDTIKCNYDPIEKWFKRYDWKLQSDPNPQVTPYVDLYNIAKDPKKSIELWEEANERYKIIEPLIQKSISELKLMKFKIKGKSISWHTVYRWILTFKENNGEMKSLIPQYTKRGLRIDKNEILEDLWKYGKEQWITLERTKMKTAYKRMQAYAKKQNQLHYCLSYSTFRRRLKSLHPKEVAEGREGKRNAEKDFKLSEAEFPHGDYALQSVQIDHTPIDVLVVDNEYRLVTEKPYLTVALDSHTRCVLGYYITYDNPQRLSIAMTLINCISSKSETLKKVRENFPEVDSDDLNTLETSNWSDVYGLPFTLHMDNGSDFTSDDIKLFGFAYKIHLHYRPVGKAEYGAYVERYLGTLNSRLHSIAGTTYSNVIERKDYPSEKRATYTIDELEARVIAEIVLYHHNYHSQIMTTPLAKWRDSFSMHNKESAINRNLVGINYGKFVLDALPSELRTVQKGGVQIHSLKYGNKKIEKWIGVKDPNDASKTRTFRIRTDPRDIRTIYFYDDTTQEYIELKCIDKLVQKYFKHQPLLLWDWRAINNDMVYRGKREEILETKLSLISLGVEMDQKTAERTKSVRQKAAVTCPTEAIKLHREERSEILNNYKELTDKIYQENRKINH